MIGEIVGAIGNIIGVNKQNRYNSVKRQAQRLKEAGFSPNALFSGVGQEAAAPAPVFDFSPNMGVVEGLNEIEEFKQNRAKTAVDQENARWLTSDSDRIYRDQNADETIHRASNASHVNEAALQGAISTTNRNAIGEKSDAIYTEATAKADLDLIKERVTTEQDRQVLLQAQSKLTGAEANELEAFNKMMQSIQGEGMPTIIKTILQWIKLSR